MATPDTLYETLSQFELSNTYVPPVPPSPTGSYVGSSVSKLIIDCISSSYTIGTIPKEKFSAEFTENLELTYKPKNRFKNFGKISQKSQ